jgi:hypothetical protein
MKKIIFALSAFAMMLASCDPSVDDISSGFNDNVTAENLQATATPVVVNGKNSNRIVVENRSPIIGHWSADQLIGGAVTSAKQYDTIYVSKTGSNIVEIECQNLNGSFKKQFTVNVDEITYIPDNIQGRLGDVKELGNTFDPSKVTVTQDVDAEGLKGNVWKVNNANGVLSDWRVVDTDGNVVATSDHNTDNLLVVANSGDYEIFLDYTKADGSKASYSCGKYTIETYTNKPEIIEYLSGETGVTTWQWFQGNGSVWGNGSFGSGTASSWWSNGLDAIDGQGGSKAGGLARNGAGATFTLDFNTNMATSGDGTTCAFKVLPLKHHDASWDKGVLHFEATGTNFVVPMGVSVNEGDKPYQDFYIIKSDDGRLNLCASEYASNGTGWFFQFELKK